MRPVLARTSSAASGLRFCGIIDEPVVNLSDSQISPVSGDAQSTISSAKRDRCNDAMGQADSVSTTKSRSATASSEFAIGRSKPSAFAVMARSMGNDVPASAPAPSGEAAAVARRHLDIGKKMMAERHRLRRLQMGKTRHDGVSVLERLLGERALIGGERAVDLIDGIAHPQPEIGCDLVVARARGVQPPRRRPDQLREPALDIHMDVLEGALEG